MATDRRRTRRARMPVFSSITKKTERDGSFMMFPSSMQKALSIYSHIEWMMKTSSLLSKLEVISSIIYQ